MTNGNGLTNGVDRHGEPKVGRRRSKGHTRDILMVLLVIGCLLILPLASLLLGPGPTSIVIDGNFNDWKDVPVFVDPSGDTNGSSSIDIVEVRLNNGDGQLNFMIAVLGQALKGDPATHGLDAFYLLIDTDRNSATGYDYEGIGADNLVELTGINGRPVGLVVSEWDSTRSSQDWAGWIQLSSGSAHTGGSKVEGSVQLTLEGAPYIRVQAFDPAGNTDFLDRPISTVAMPYATLSSLAKGTMKLGEETSLASIELTGMPGQTISIPSVDLDLRSVYNASALGRFEISLRRDNGDHVMDGTDTVVGSASVDLGASVLPVSKDLQVRIAFSQSMQLALGASVQLWATVKALGICGSVGVAKAQISYQTVLDNATMAVPVVTEDTGDGYVPMAYVGPSDGIRIDGSFVDWDSLAGKVRTVSDPAGDTKVPNLDLLDVTSLMDNGSLFLSTRVSGRALEGSAIPYKTMKAAEPGGGSGPGGGGQPPAPQPRLGNDRTEIFIDALTGNGYHPSWLPVNAQYMVAIEGRNGEVTSSVLYEFSGDTQTEFKWNELGRIGAATGGLGGSRLEIGVPQTMMPLLGSGFGIFVRTTDWDKKTQDTGGQYLRVPLQFAISSFDPLEGKPDLPLNYTITQPQGYFIVQFDGPVTEETIASVEALETGAKEVDLVPTYGIVVRLPSNDPKVFNGLEHVRYVGIFQPAFRLQQNLLNRTGEQVLLVTTYQNVIDVAAAIEVSGGSVESISGAVVKFKINMTYLPTIARIPDIKLIGPNMIRSIQNDVARGITNSNTVNYVFGLTGKGQIIAVADTGLDTGNDADHQPDHPDLTGKVIKWYDVAKADGDCTTADCTPDKHGHGTHVTGTAVGAGNASNGQYRGVAPEAKIVFQALDATGAGGLSLPGDLHDLYKDPYSDGARVHQNSWGDPTVATLGNYLIDCENTDDFIWGNDTMLIVFAAGNAGSGANTTESPGTSKNVLTVGASENYRPYFDSNGDDISQIAGFSSRGNTSDGRIKPDIVAPGTWILSTQSSKATAGGLWWQYNTKYQYSGGTSMAAPHVSGAAIIARQYYVDYQNITPSAALLKATLINGADDIGTADIPNVNEGWGRLNLTNSLFPQSPRVLDFVDNRTGFSSGDKNVTYNFTIGEAKVPLKITLVWSDYKGNSGAAQSASKLVNNLDLTVKNSTGTVFKGNVFANGYSKTGGTADKLNNVECVYFKAPTNGTYSITVSPKTITKGKQPFAIVVSGELVPDLEVTSIATYPASPQAGSNVWINATIKNKGSEDTPPILRSTFGSMNLAALTSENLTDVAFSPDGKFALIVGTNRTILKYTVANKTLFKMDTRTVPWTDFEGVAFNPKGHPQDRSKPEALLVGTNGTIVDYNGSKFINVTGPSSSEHFLDVGWNDNGTRALIVGKDGKVYTFPKTVSVLSDDFENGNGKWYLSKNSRWAIVNTDKVSGSNSLGYDHKGGAGTGDDLTRFLSKQDVSGTDFRSSYLEFQNKYDTPAVNGNIAGFFLHFTKDNNSLTQMAIYTSFQGAAQGWYKEHFDLKDYTPTDSFNLRFFVTAAAGYQGHAYWWIDDVYLNKTTYVATKVDYPTGGGSAVLNGVAFAPGTDKAILVGDGGVAWKFSAGALTSLNSGTTEDLRAVSFKPQSKTALIVGSNAKVQRYNTAGDTFTDLAFINSTASLYDVAYRQDQIMTGQTPDLSQALIVGSGGGAWNYYGYDGHFETVSTGTTKTLYGAAYNYTRWPDYGPGFLVGHGSGPVVLKDTTSLGHRPFIVNFYKGNGSASWSANYLGQVIVTGGLAPDPYPPCDSKVLVSFHWMGSGAAGTYNVTARVDITNNESVKPPNPDRINEVDEWYNNQLSSSLTLVPEFQQIMVPVAGTVVIVLIIRRHRKNGRKL